MQRLWGKSALCDVTRGTDSLPVLLPTFSDNLFKQGVRFTDKYLTVWDFEYFQLLASDRQSIQIHSDAKTSQREHTSDSLAIEAAYLTIRREIKSSLQPLYLKWTRDWGDVCLNPGELEAKWCDPLNYVLLNIGHAAHRTPWNSAELNSSKYIKSQHVIRFSRAILQVTVTSRDAWPVIAARVRQFSWCIWQVK